MSKKKRLMKTNNFLTASAAMQQAQQNQILMAQQAEQIRLMQQAAAANAGPGQWAPDPSGRFVKRYYDGQKWTQWVTDAAGEQHIDPPNS